MKGIAQILFGCAMFLLGIFSAVMLLGVSDWYLFFGLAIVAPLLGVAFAIIGLMNVCQKDKDEMEKTNGSDEQTEVSDKID